MPAVLSLKGGLMMGTKKVRALSSRQKRAIIIIPHFARLTRRKDWCFVQSWSSLDIKLLADLDKKVMMRTIKEKMILVNGNSH